MIIGMDASNITDGGGLNHLVNILNNFNKNKFKDIEIIVWCKKDVIKLINKHNKINILTNKYLNSSNFYRLIWQKFFFKKEAIKLNCSISFVLGGSTLSNFNPLITINQNLLPFFDDEVKKYFPNFFYFKFKILKYLQIATFRKATGIIFLTNFSYKYMKNLNSFKINNYSIIPHGISPIFSNPNRLIKDFQNKEKNKKIKILYVSSIEYYKNHLALFKVIKRLKEKNYSVTLDVVGSGNQILMNSLKNFVKLNQANEYIIFHDKLSLDEINYFYRKSDIFVFPSSCESFGQILLESMSSKLPILCSNKSGLEETCKNGAIYFNPENINEFFDKLELLINNLEIRKSISDNAFKISEEFNWKACSDLTFNFIIETLKNNQKLNLNK